MHRTTVMLPDDLAMLVDHERRRRQVSTADLIRKALEAYLNPRGGRPRYSFIGMASKDVGNASDRVEEFLAQHWAADILADSGS